MSRYENGTSPMMQKCSYNNLGQTYNSSMAPVAATSTSGVMVVPSWGPVGDGYSSLVLPGKSCSGYGTIATAYGGSKGCNANFISRACSQ